MTISTRLPEATRPSTTPEEHSAASASAALARMAPSAAISSARLRAGVMRGGSGAPSTTVTPKRGFVGSNTARALIIMRTVMPRGASVYLAIHSAKRSVSAGSGGTSRRAVMAFSFLGSTGFPGAPTGPPTGLSQTTPMRLCGPNGTSTKHPGSSSMPSGTM